MSMTATSKVTPEALQHFLDRKVKEYDQPSFIPDDPISIPHAYQKKQDIEIAGFFAAVFSWGNRTTIIRKSRELMRLMDNSPHQFILNHTEREMRKLLSFKHRTFNPTDLLYFIDFFQHHYSQCDTLEDAFLRVPATGVPADEGSATRVPPTPGTQKRHFPHFTIISFPSTSSRPIPESISPPLNATPAANASICSCAGWSGKTVRA